MVIGNLVVGYGIVQNLGILWHGKRAKASTIDNHSNIFVHD